MRAGGVRHAVHARSPGRHPGRALAASGPAAVLTMAFTAKAAKASMVHLPQFWTAIAATALALEASASSARQR